MLIWVDKKFQIHVPTRDMGYHLHRSLQRARIPANIGGEGFSSLLKGMKAAVVMHPLRVMRKASAPGFRTLAERLRELEPDAVIRAEDMPAALDSFLEPFGLGPLGTSWKMFLPDMGRFEHPSEDDRKLGLELMESEREFCEMFDYYY